MSAEGRKKQILKQRKNSKIKCEKNKKKEE